MARQTALFLADTGVARAGSRLSCQRTVTGIIQTAAFSGRMGLRELASSKMSGNDNDADDRRPPTGTPEPGRHPGLRPVLGRGHLPVYWHSCNSSLACGY